MKTLREVERDAIVEALLHFKGNTRKAAWALGISRTTIDRKIDSYHIPMGEVRQGLNPLLPWLERRKERELLKRKPDVESSEVEPVIVKPEIKETEQLLPIGMVK